jgi:hypothetical protein
MSDLSRLESTFGRTERPKTASPTSGDGGVTADYEAKLRRLGQRWSENINTIGALESYASASEVDMAIVTALVKRNFTDAEIWRTLRDSPRYQDRVTRKGQQHTDNLYAKEIEKARQVVTPFPPDAPRPAHAERGSRRPYPLVQQPTTVAERPRPAPVPVRPILPPFTLATPADSFVSRYVRYAAKRTDAPLEAHELMAIGGLSALAGPVPRLPIATSVHGWKLSLWVLYIVNSTVGRKSTVLNLMRDILAPILGEHALIEWEGSPQGLIQRLQDRDGQSAVFLRDEYSGLVQQMNRGGHMAGLTQTLIRAYDGGVIENIRVKKKNRDGEMERDVDRVADPYLVTLSASTRDSFITRCTIDNVLDGFLARFVFVTGYAEPRPLKELEASVRTERDELVQHARDFAARADQFGDIALHPDVLAAAWDTEQAWLKEADASNHPDALAASFKRLSESVLKVAALLAIDRGEISRVELEDYQAALRMGDRWRRSTLEIVETLGATDFQRTCDLVLASVRRQPGIPLSHLYRLHRKLRKRDFDEVLAALAEQAQLQLVERQSDGQQGRPPIRIYPAVEEAAYAP